MGLARSASASESRVKEIIEKEISAPCEEPAICKLLDLQCGGKLVVLTALEALVDGCHHVGGLLPGVQQSRLKGRRNKSSVSAAPWSPHTVKTPMEHVMPRCLGLLRYLVDGEDVRQEVAAAGA